MAKKLHTADQTFSLWVRRIVILFGILFCYYLFADIKMPLTPQAMVERPIVQISSQVSGSVVHVNVANNEHIKAGQSLFQIDPRPYQLAVEKARLALRQARLSNHKLDVSIIAAKADIASAKAVYHQRKRDAQRMKKLYRQHAVSSSKYDSVISAEETAAASLSIAQAKLQELHVQRGEKGDDNLLHRQALNQLETAQLNLSYTDVKASQSGVVTNLQLQPGAMARAGNPLLAVVSERADVVADFREKNLRHIQPGSKAWVAFDSRPAEIYAATVIGIDAGVSSGQFNANGVLATPTSSNRWVRDAQRLRVHLKVKNMPEFASGARANVQLLPESSFLSWIAKQQIRFISALHYIY